VDVTGTTITEEGSLIKWIGDNNIDIQIVFQVNRGWYYKTPRSLSENTWANYIFYEK